MTMISRALSVGRCNVYEEAKECVGKKLADCEVLPIIKELVD